MSILLKRSIAIFAIALLGTFTASMLANASSDSDDQAAIEEQEAAALEAAEQLRAREAQEVSEFELIDSPPNVISDQMTPEMLDEAVEQCEESNPGSFSCRVLVQVQQGDIEPGGYSNEAMERALSEAESDG